MEKKQETEELQRLNAELRELVNADSTIEKSSITTEERSEMEKSAKKKAGKETRKRKAERKRRKASGGKGKRAGGGGRKRLRIVMIVIAVLLLLVIIGGVSLLIMREQGKSALLAHSRTEIASLEVPEEVTVNADGSLVSWQGRNYQRNNDVISILLMGVDREELDNEELVSGENGQTDTLVLVVLDSSTGKLTFINISRDSMVDVDLYNVDSEYAGTEEIQLALAYAYGDGRETSCENTLRSVSRLFYGMPVDAYAAIDLPAINVLNDLIGGVEVDVLEDLTLVAPEMTVGAHILLQGEQAETYLRTRQVEEEDAPIDANNLRMERQKQYLVNFISTLLAKTREDITTPLSMFRAITPYLVTDISTSEVTYLASLALQGSFSADDMMSVPGEVILGEDGYAEYHVDEEGLYQMILDVFYREV